MTTEALVQNRADQLVRGFGDRALEMADLRVKEAEMRSDTRSRDVWCRVKAEVKARIQAERQAARAVEIQRRRAFSRAG